MSRPSIPPGRFLQARPDDLREAHPGHRLSYVVREMPAFLERLATELSIGESARVLDYGCADAPYRHFFSSSAEVVTADLPGNPNATVEVGSDGTLPLEAESFDAVMSTQVLEHVSDPRLYLSECHRVLRPGGRMLLSTHGIFPYHPDPTDYWRWTSAGLRRTVAEAGFEVRRFEGFVGLTGTGLQLVQEGVYHRLPPALRPVLALFMQALIRLAERFQTPEGRSSDALVFALVAEKPACGS
jgi:SAM-dependent methyltransferase